MSLQNLNGSNFSSTLNGHKKLLIWCFFVAMLSKWQAMHLCLWIPMIGGMFSFKPFTQNAWFSSIYEFSWRNHTIFCYSFKPDAIVFDSSKAYGTPSYWMQHFFKESNGAILLNSKLQADPSTSIVASAISWNDSDKNKSYVRIKVWIFSWNCSRFKEKKNCKKLRKRCSWTHTLVNQMITFYYTPSRPNPLEKFYRAFEARHYTRLSLNACR